jgi:hypothetical protein
MRRRKFTALAGASVSWPFAAMAQEPGRTYWLGALRGTARTWFQAARLEDGLPEWRMAGLPIVTRGT